MSWTLMDFLSAWVALTAALFFSKIRAFTTAPSKFYSASKVPSRLSFQIHGAAACQPGAPLRSSRFSRYWDSVAMAASCVISATALSVRSRVIARVTMRIKAKERMEKPDFDPRPPENIWRCVDGGVLGDHDVCEMADAMAVADLACRRVADALSEAIKWRGSASLALPGGSVMSMMGGLVDAVHGGKFASVDWSKVHIAYVNHKCVPIEDDRANHRKALNMFANKLAIPSEQFVVPDGSSDGRAEATAYQTKLLTLSSDILPKDADGIPQFDVLLLGVGTDGHIGSLYPGMGEITRTDGYVLHVEQEGKPPSITLSLPVINHAKEVIVIATGEEKAQAMRTALMEDAGDSGKSCPAQAVHPKEVSTWILDRPAASLLRPGGIEV